MGVAWHEVVDLGIGPGADDMDEVLEQCGEAVDFRTEVKAHIGRDLVVPRSAGMEFTSNGTDEFGQPAFVGGMDIFVCRTDDEGPVRPLGFDGRETFHDRLSLGGGEETGGFEGAGVGLRSSDVFLVHSLSRRRWDVSWGEGVEGV